MNKPIKSVSPSLLAAALAAALLLLPATAARAQGFDFDTGNAPAEVLIPAAIPILLNDVSAGANDATLILRITSEITTAWFDAIAPYHPTAVGVYSRLGRRPASESATNRNKNIAIFYATYRVISSLLPNEAANFGGLLQAFGLDPNDNSTDTTTAIGIGNAAGNAVVAFREHDGMNQLGDENGRIYNRLRYMDSTGYKPVNTAYDIIDPTKWQPYLLTAGNGLFRVQQYVTPQLATTKPYVIRDLTTFTTPEPTASLLNRGANGRALYKQQVDDALATSASLDNYKKAQAEFFDNKFRSIGFVAFFIAQTHNFTLDQFVQYDHMLNIAAFDGAIVSWREKTRWNAVRPFTAIKYQYGSGPVTAWGGPGKGTVTDLPADQYRTYLTTPDHPEYPSGSTCFCAAEAQASRRLLNTDQLGWPVLVPQGQSRVEPGITPTQDTTLFFETWTDFENQCGQGRVLGGVHFQPAVAASLAMCRPIGDLAYDFVQAHLNGTAQ
jgi:hypothetical protein